MTRPNDPDVPPTPTDAGKPASRARRFGTPIVASLAVVGGLAVAPQVLPASAAPGAGQWALESQVAPRMAPPAGYVWLQGALTDQAGHRLDNVNVEVWSNDPKATEPVASNLTYGGAPADGRHQHGAYRVQVPIGQPYRIVFSAVGGQEDGDAFRMQSYGAGRPIMARTAGRAAAVSPRTVRNLGTTELVHQGRVKSTVRATLHPRKVKKGKRGTLRVRVTSPFVKPVTGKVVARVHGRKIAHQLRNGTSTFKLPKLKAGKHQVRTSFSGTGTVRGDQAKAVKLTVKKKKKRK